MAYLEQAVGNLAAIPAIVSSFAAARGWAVGSGTIQCPDGLTYGFDVTQTATTQSLAVYDTANPARRATTRLLNTAGTQSAPVILMPTKIHLFGNDAPYDSDGPDAPYIAIVIECGYNHYRHLYLGKLVKLGEYGGGDVITGNQFQTGGLSATSPASASAHSDNHRRLFAARNTSSAGDDVGGVLIEHEANPTPWRGFRASTTNSNPNLNLNGSEVMGGHGDAFNDGLVKRGVVPFTGSNVLIPINLLIPNPGGLEVRFVPIGVPPGLRMCDVRSIVPGADIEVGNDTWKVFPEFSKQPSTTVQRLNNGYWWDNETSHNLGYAYRLDN